MSNLSLEQPNQHVSIDLVICTYNNAALLERALTAISKQRVPDDVKWTVLVVNNNSTDETSEVVEKHVRLETIPHLSCIFEFKQGLNYARHCGIMNTAGKWIAFVDDDCMLEEDWVAQAAEFAAAYSECGAFGGKVILDWETPPPTFVLNFAYCFAQQDHGADIMQPTCLAGAGLVINRKAILDANWLSKQFLEDRTGKKLVSGGDVEIVMRIRSAGYDIWYNPACKLMHFIPAKRFEQHYLVKINYGLGVSQLFADGLVWDDSYLKFLLVSVFSNFRFSIRVLKQFLNVVLGRSNTKLAEIDVNLAFVRGKWAGIGRMLRMKSQQRQALLGAAKLTPLKNQKAF